MFSENIFPIRVCRWSFLPAPGINNAQPDLFRDEKKPALIADSGNSVIDYFSPEFTVPEMHLIQRENTYLFPCTESGRHHHVSSVFLHESKHTRCSPCPGKEYLL